MVVGMERFSGKSKSQNPAELEKKGALNLAAEGFLKAGDFRNSSRIFDKLGLHDKAINILTEGGYFSDASKLAEKSGRIYAAAKLSEDAGDFERAINLFEKTECFREAERVRKLIKEKSKPLTNLQARLAGFTGLVSFVASGFFVANSFTGNVVGNLHLFDLNILGVLLFVYGLAGVFLYVKNKF